MFDFSVFVADFGTCRGCKMLLCGVVLLVAAVIFGVVCLNKSNCVAVIFDCGVDSVFSLGNSETILIGEV